MRKVYVGMLTFVLCLWAISAMALPDDPVARFGFGSVDSVAFSPDGSILAIGSEFGIYLYDSVTFKQIHYLTSIVTSVAFSPDGKILASGSYKEVKLWDVSSGALIKTLTGHTDDVRSVAFSPDGKILASGSADGTVLLWDMRPYLSPTTKGIKGDVNNDGVVKSNDAMLALRISAGLMIPDEYQKWAADMNGDGVVRSNDAMLILRKAAGLSAPNRDIIASSDRIININLSEVYGVSGESITVPIIVDNIDILSSGDISISYDSSVLRVVGVSSEQSMLLESNINNSGIVRISFAGTDKLVGNEIAKVKFDVISDKVSQLSIKTAELYNRDAIKIMTKVIDGKFTSFLSVPDKSALLQNYPNPFNPDTWIPYQLKDGSEVKICIYDVTGTLVRRLDLGYKPAGIYTSRDRSAYWDGRNELGEQVSSGIYFYTIQAGKYRATGKMLMLK